MPSAITAAREMALCQFCQEVLWRPSGHLLEGALGLLAESWVLPDASVALRELSSEERSRWWDPRAPGQGGLAMAHVHPCAREDPKT